MAYGTVVASLTVEGFGLDRLKLVDPALRDFLDAVVEQPVDGVLGLDGFGAGQLGDGGMIGHWSSSSGCVVG